MRHRAAFLALIPAFFVVLFILVMRSGAPVAAKAAVAVVFFGVSLALLYTSGTLLRAER